MQVVKGTGLICCREADKRKETPVATISEIIHEFLEEAGWDCKDVGLRSVRSVVSGECGRWLWSARWNEDDTLVACYSICPAYIPEPRRQEAGEYLTRANYRLWYGSFEMDLADGEVRFKTSLLLMQDPLTRTMFNDLVYWNCQMMESYMPGLLAVGFGNISAEHAIAAVENSDTDDAKENTEKADKADSEDEQALPSGLLRRLMEQENWN